MFGYVYLIADGASGHCKIGRSVNPDGRFIELGGKTVPMTLIHTIRCADYVASERYLHKAFSLCRIRDEWFDLSRENVDLLCGITSVDSESDWPETIRRKHSEWKQKRASCATVNLPEPWQELAQEMASEQMTPTLWLIIELIRREAVARGKKQLPGVPWGSSPSSSASPRKPRKER